MRGPGGCRHDGAAGGGGSAAGRWAEGREGGAGEARGRGRNAPASPRESPGTVAGGLALGPARPPRALRPWPTLAHPAALRPGAPSRGSPTPGSSPYALAARRRHAPCRPGRASASPPAPAGTMERGRRPGLGPRFTPPEAGARSEQGPTVLTGDPTAVGRHPELRSSRPHPP